MSNTNLFLVLLSSVVSWSQLGFADSLLDRKWCWTDVLDPKVQSGACTRLIEYGNLSENELALAYLRRAHISENSNRRSSDIQQAIRLKPNDAKARYSLALHYKYLNKPELSLSALQEAIRLKPDYSEAHRFIGAILTRPHEYDLAIEAYTKAIYYNPDDARSFIDRGSIYLYESENLKELEDFKRAYRMGYRDHFSMRLLRDYNILQEDGTLK